MAANANHQGLTAGGVSPSDSSGAIGPLHYMEVENAQIGMFDRTLSPLSTVGLNTFVGTAGGLSSVDPQVQWDQQAGRWEYSAVEVDTTTPHFELAFGWSRASDTTALTLNNSDWCNFHIDTMKDLYDYAKLGHDSNYLLIGANVYPNNSVTFDHSALIAVSKPVPGVTTCTAPAATTFSLGADFTPVPGNLTDNGVTGHIVAIGPNAIKVWHVSPNPQTGCLTPPCVVFDGPISITAWTRPTPPAQGYTVPQPGGNPAIDALDGRLTQAIEHTDPSVGTETVWTQHTSPDRSGRTIVTWFELIPAGCASGTCSAAAKRQEGVLSDANLYLFNAAISPTSHGDGAVINYNTGSAGTFVDVRAQSRDGADPLSSMSGPLVLRESSVADTDFSCYNPNGPPCRWGDYAGASPDPTDCASVWGSNMLSGDVSAGGKNPTWVTQNFALSIGPVRSTVSTRQYALNGSDGTTWQDMDPAQLRLGATPCVATNAVISANVDLFTAQAGINQDIALFVDVDGVASPTPAAWKESGGLNGTFSPNAAYVMGVVPMQAGHAYTIRLTWKSNAATAGSIYAGAGPLFDGTYSPTRLTMQLYPNAPQVSRTTSQPRNTGSDGKTWIAIPGLAPVQITPGADSRVILSGNADLWTDTAGYNQDIGAMVGGGSFGAGTLVAWKESGGFAGTYSPNAAFVQTTVSMSAGVAYSAWLAWKTNVAAPPSATIFAGAGPLSSGEFSPTSLTALLFAAGSNPTDNVNVTQPSLANSDGSSWIPLGQQIALPAAVASTTSMVTANVDLWTADAGPNEDIGIAVSDNNSPFKVLVWKESGGFAGTFSPNAAFAETVFSMTAGHTYTFALVWKTNRASGSTIYAGAGPINGAYSPTRLSVFITG